MVLKRNFKKLPLLAALLLVASFCVQLVSVPQLANATTYNIGDTGPAGGIIFYIDGDIYYEAAPNDLTGTYEWGCNGLPVINDDVTAIGTGEQNTAGIVAASCSPITAGRPIAADSAASYSQNGYEDWFLPSIDELNELYEQKAIVGGFSTSQYWSSTENYNGQFGELSYDCAYAKSFNAGFVDDTYYRSQDNQVRPIRSFSASEIIPFDTVNTTISATIASTISISTSGTVNLSVTPESGGRLSSNKDTVTVSTNHSTGYLLRFVTNSGSELLGADNYIDTTTATQANPAALGVNEWGYRVDDLSGFGAGPTAVETNTSSSSYTWAGVPEPGVPQVLHSTGAPASGDVTEVWYAANIDTTKPAGSYAQTITYTAVTN